MTNKIFAASKPTSCQLWLLCIFVRDWHVLGKDEAEVTEK